MATAPTRGGGNSSAPPRRGGGGGSLSTAPTRGAPLSRGNARGIGVSRANYSNTNTGTTYTPIRRTKTHSLPFTDHAGIPSLIVFRGREDSPLLPPLYGFAVYFTHPSINATNVDGVGFFEAVMKHAPFDRCSIRLELYFIPVGGSTPARGAAIGSSSDAVQDFAGRPGKENDDDQIDDGKDGTDEDQDGDKDVNQDGNEGENVDEDENERVLSACVRHYHAEKARRGEYTVQIRAVRRAAVDAGQGSDDEDDDDDDDDDDDEDDNTGNQTADRNLPGFVPTYINDKTTDFHNSLMYIYSQPHPHSPSLSQSDNPSLSGSFANDNVNFWTTPSSPSSPLTPLLIRRVLFDPIPQDHYARLTADDESEPAIVPARSTLWEAVTIPIPNHSLKRKLDDDAQEENEGESGSGSRSEYTGPALAGQRMFEIASLKTENETDGAWSRALELGWERW